MQVEVAYALPDKQTLLAISVQVPCTIAQAIEQSGILHQHPEIDLTKNKVGIFSEIYPLKRELKENERVEIYRALSVNPMEARRQRAVKQQQ